MVEEVSPVVEVEQAEESAEVREILGNMTMQDYANMDREVLCVRPENLEERETLQQEIEDSKAEPEEEIEPEPEKVISINEAVKVARSLRAFTEFHGLDIDLEPVINRIENFKVKSSNVKIQPSIIAMFKKGLQ